MPVCTGGCRASPRADRFGVKGRRWLVGLQLAVEERGSVDAAMRQAEFLDAEIVAVERLIAKQALSWPEIRRLMTVPGVNLVCAASFIPSVGNLCRFFTSRKLIWYLGPGSAGQAARGDTRAQRTDLQARFVYGALGSGGGGMDGGAEARPLRASYELTFIDRSKEQPRRIR